MHLSPPHTIGIIGGTGKTGGQFARLFESQGFTVRTTGSKDAAQHNAQLIAECDVVIFAVPLASSVDIITREVQHAVREDQLVLDLCSLKKQQVDAMRNASGEVIGMHPLFGPTTDPRGQIIILCPARCEQATQTSLQNLLATMGMRTLVFTPEQHDHLMAMIQVIPHLKSFLMADVLKQMDANLTELFTTCTPAYELELNVVGRFLDDTAALYGPIIFQNPETRTALKCFRDALDRCIQIAESNDQEQFAHRYEELSAFFGSYAQKARQSSEECIKTLAKR